MNPTGHDFRELSEITEEHLDFRAIDSGLGFSPNTRQVFEHGARTGMGAVSAGKPQFTANAKPLHAPAQAQSVSPVTLPGASVKLRLAAFLADLAIVLTPWLGAVLWASKHWQIKLISRPDIILFSGVVLISYFLLTESLGGQSLGKMLFQLRAVEDDKYEKPIGLRRTTMRLIGLIIGTAFFGLGLLLSFIDHKRRPWHDKFSGSIVRQKLY